MAGHKTGALPKDQDPAALAPQAGFLARLLILTFILSYLTFSVAMIADGWIHNHSLIRKLLGLAGTESLPPLFTGAIFALIGSVLGCGVLDMVSFHKYVAIKRDFQTVHVWGYFFAPWLAAILGLVVFALLQSGLLIFSGTSASKEPPTDVANLGFLAIGFLSGFGWYDVTERIRKLVKRMFAESGQAGVKDDNRGISERMSNVDENTDTSSGTTRLAQTNARKPKPNQSRKKKKR